MFNRENIMTDDQLAQNIDKYFKFLKTGDIDPVTLYLEGLAVSGRRSMRSLLVTAANVFEFEGEMERMPWPLLQYHHIAQVRSTLQSQGKSANTINLTLSACRGVMKACFNLGLIQADQLMLINEVKRVRGKRLPSGRCLSQYETKALISACRQDKSIAGKRDLAVIVLMLATGLRRSEVVALDIDDYSTRNGQLIVMEGNKQRAIFIQTEARRLIKPWISCRGKTDGKLFQPISNKNNIMNRAMTSQSLYDLIKKRSIEAKIENCSPHDFRRTFVTRLLESGVDINTVRQLAGHSDIQTTARYDLRDEKEQKRAIKQTTLVL
jgi:site-specific recombinase XerD